jgi:predicted small lipoprotein YifL
VLRVGDARFACYDLIAMVRHIAARALVRIATSLVVVTLTACGIKGPLRPPPPATPTASQPAPQAPTNPEARPPLLPSEPPSAIAPNEPAKKP